MSSNSSLAKPLISRRDDEAIPRMNGVSWIDFVPDDQGSEGDLRLDLDQISADFEIEHF